MKKIILGTLAATVVVASSAQAESFVNDWAASGNVTLVSDYEFRGLSQSDEGPALQSMLTAQHDSGLYVSLWGSNVDFNDGDKANLILNPYVGYAGETNGIGWDVGATYYYYPSVDSKYNYDFAEIYLGLSKSFGDFSAGTKLSYSPDYFGGSGDTFHGMINAGYAFTETFSADALVGYVAIDKNQNFGVDDYTHWRVGLNYTPVENTTAFLRYVSTDLKEPEDCADNCEDRVIAGFSYNF